MEHLAWAHWFRSPIVRDEFFVRRLPDYFVDLYSGPCREEISNSDGNLNGIGAGGLGQVWVPDAGTVLLAATDLTQKSNGDFDSVWSQLPINAIVAQTVDGQTLCTGWTGSTMQADEAGREVTITGGIAPEVKDAWGTRMTNAIQWTRKISFADHSLTVEIEAKTDRPINKAYELIPIAQTPETTIGTISREQVAVAKEHDRPWEGSKDVGGISIRRGNTAATIFPLDPNRTLAVSWAENTVPKARHARLVSRAMRIEIPIAGPTQKFSLKWRMEFSLTADTAIANDDAMLPGGSTATRYNVALESPLAQPLYWRISAGALPDGISLNRNGLLTGTPTRDGRFIFDVAGENPYAGRPFFEKDFSAKRMTIQISK
jgi:hypothetical protein